MQARRAAAANGWVVTVIRLVAKTCLETKYPLNAGPIVKAIEKAMPTNA